MRHRVCGAGRADLGVHSMLGQQPISSSLCTILDRFSGNVNEQAVVLGRIIDALGKNVRLASKQGGPHALVEAYVNFLGK